MRIVRGMLAAALLLAALAGCCLFPETATLIIQNDSSYVVDEVYITPVGSSDLCEDWLPAMMVIPPGTSHAFRGIDPGAYDVLVGETGEGWWPVANLVLGPGDRVTLPLED